MTDILNAGGKFINRYLLPIDGGYCLVDTGYEWEYSDFIEKMAKIGISSDRIRYVIITHMHADHAGFLKKFLTDNESAALIYDTDDRMRLEAGKNNLNTFISGFITLCVSKLSVAFVDKTQCFPAVFTDRFIDAKTQPLEEYGIKFYFFKGHTEHDLALSFEGKLFCGDICMSGIGATKHAPAWIYNKFALVETWRQIAEMEDITKIYPAHGKPFAKKDLGACIEYWKTKGVFRLFGRSNVWQR
jgi:glyoxylase-like metal-dependent hydrolase (beta-lactamase superfamily II)